MKTRTKILVGAGTVVAVLLVALATLPFLFADRIAARVKTEVNSALEARVDWRDAGLSLFGDFPNLTLRLDDLSIAGTRLFAGDTLARIHRLGVVLDLRRARTSADRTQGPRRRQRQLGHREEDGRQRAAGVESLQGEPPEARYQQRDDLAR